MNQKVGDRVENFVYLFTIPSQRDRERDGWTFALSRVEKISAIERK